MEKTINTKELIKEEIQILERDFDYYKNKFEKVKSTLDAMKFLYENIEKIER